MEQRARDLDPAIGRGQLLVRREYTAEAIRSTAAGIDLGEFRTQRISRNADAGRQFGDRAGGD